VNENDLIRFNFGIDFEWLLAIEKYVQRIIIKMSRNCQVLYTFMGESVFSRKMNLFVFVLVLKLMEATVFTVPQCLFLFFFPFCFPFTYEDDFPLYLPNNLDCRWSQRYLHSWETNPPLEIGVPLPLSYFTMVSSSFPEAAGSTTEEEITGRQRHVKKRLTASPSSKKLSDWGNCTPWPGLPVGRKK
jgi:hypothetical protein